MKPRSRLLLCAALLLLIAGAVAWESMQGHPQLPRELIRGGDAGGLPRVNPLDERIDPAALERIVQEPAAAGLKAFIVMRDGYIVFERYSGGLNAESVVDGGAFAQTLLAMVVGVAANDGTLQPVAAQMSDPNALRDAIEAGAHQRYALYLSRALWSRLNAGPAWIEYPVGAAAIPVDCCLHARVLDWMRVASVLVDNGRFEGKQVLPIGWVQRMQRPRSLDSLQGSGVELAAAAHGIEPFATQGVFFLRGPQHWRLWLVPPLKLAVLFGADEAAAWDETRLANLVIRALSDRPPEPGNLSDLQRLVPGH